MTMFFEKKNLGSSRDAEAVMDKVVKLSDVDISKEFDIIKLSLPLLNSSRATVCFQLCSTKLNNVAIL